MRVEIEIIVPDENDDHQPAQIIEQYHLQQLPFEFGIAEGESGDHLEKQDLLSVVFRFGLEDRTTSEATRNPYFVNVVICSLIFVPSKRLKSY